jgi:hypothetical protein
VLTTCQPSTVWCSRERLPAAAAQPAKVRQSCSATDYYFIIIYLLTKHCYIQDILHGDKVRRLSYFICLGVVFVCSCVPEFYLFCEHKSDVFIKLLKKKLPENLV